MSTPSTWLPSIWRLVAVLAVLLVVAACGGDDGVAGEDTAADGEAADAADGDGDAADEGDEGAEDTEAADEGEFDEAAVEEFYRDNTVTIVVATEPGGGFDTFARLYARHMPQYMPGEPTIVVDNRPGAGHMIGLSHVYNVAPRDGTVIGTADGAVVLQQVIGAPGVEFDFSKFQYLGMPDAPVNMVLVARADAGVESFEDLLADDGPELIVGISAPGTITADVAILARDVLGANLQNVGGYEGTATRALAVEQGEVQAFVTSSDALTVEFADKIESGEWVVLLQLAEPGQQKYLDDVPTIQSFAADEEERRMLAVGSTLRSYVRPYFVHEEVPEDRCLALKAAWEQATGDPEFVREAEEAGRPAELVTGEELEEVYQSFLDTPPAMVELLRDALDL